MIGARIEGYRIAEQIAKGGVATIYRAVQEGSGAELAVKFVARSREDYVAQRARMRHEASIGLRASHASIVRTFTTGEVAEGCYAIQELLRGRPLHHILRAETRPGAGLPLREALTIGLDLAEALAHLHEKSVVHADLKPPNVILCGARAVICDLGLAVLEGESRATLIGSPSYMAPEAREGAPITRKADLWALGVILFEMLGGVRPFGLRDDGPLEILKAARESPLPLGWLKEQPEPVRALITELLEKDPARRLGNAGEAARRLRGVSPF